MKKKMIYAILVLFFLLVLGCLALTNHAHKKYENGQLKIFFCGQYLSDEILKQFEEKFKIKVNCSTFESNEQLYAKLKNKIKYDVIFPSDYMISKLIKENMIQPINKNLIENYSEIDHNFKGSHCGFDPTDEFSIPYTSGIIAIVYNKPMIEKITHQVAENVVQGFDCLFKSDLKKEILMFTSNKDCFAIANKTLGNSINTTNPQKILDAAKLLKYQKSLVQAYVDETADKMINEEAAIAVSYSGDILNMMEENKNLKCCFPKEGSVAFVDAMCIPKKAENLENAHKFINFMCSAEVAAKNCKYSSFSTTIKSAFNLLDDKTKNNEIAYPSQSKIDQCETQKFLDYETEQKISDLWEQIKTN